MDEKRKQRLQRIFYQAVELAGDEREAFLSNACGDDQELREEIEKLLVAHEHADSDFLSAPVVEIPSRVTDQGETLIPEMIAGTKFGRYEILEEIGEGGMGAVYLAEQKEPIYRKVALKIIHPEKNGRDVVQRFHLEGQVLALMTHRNIARIYDADVSKEGQPFLAMELVSGIPITKYCDENRLTIEERLLLFSEVCGAVQHAHQNGIIHRDIKPDNVLVAIEDGKAVPKVIDFGIAKPTVSLNGNAVHTNRWQLIGTPHYMSPEQTRANDNPVDTRTDIYSLGVLLYELLVGLSPIDLPEDASLEDLLQKIRDEEPIKPSLCTSSKNSAELAKCRRLTPRSFTRKFHGDLDWIVLKSLEKDRTRRYTAASEFASDIDRHLRHEPVLAGPATASYRLRTLIRKHRAAFVAATVLGLALIGGGIGTTLGLFKAYEEIESTKRISGYLENMIGSVDPKEFGDRHVLFVDVVRKAAQDVEKQFEGKSLLEASIRVILGKTFHSLGRLEDAEVQQRSALRIRQSSLGAKHPDTLAVMTDLSLSLLDLGELEDAGKLQRKVLDARRRIFGDDHSETITSMHNFASTLYGQGEFDEARKLQEKILKTQRRILGNDHLQTLKSMRSLAAILRVQGELHEARQLLEETHDGFRRVLGDDHPDTEIVVKRLSTVQKELGLNRE